MEDVEAPDSVAAAYGRIGVAWSGAPARIYRRLAEELLGRCPVPLAGATVLDVGAGTGVASEAAQAKGAHPIALDLAAGMLQVDQHRRPPAAVADATALPIATGAVDVVVAAFSYNHLADPVPALADAARVLRAGGALLASVYNEDDTHPVKEAVEATLVDAGYEAPAFYVHMKADAVPRLATPERAEAAAREAGLRSARATPVRVAFPELSPIDLVEWRLGMAQTAWFVDGLTPTARVALVEAALVRLGGDPPVLERSVIDLVATA